MAARSLGPALADVCGFDVNNALRSSPSSLSGLAKTRGEKCLFIPASLMIARAAPVTFYAVLAALSRDLLSARPLRIAPRALSVTNSLAEPVSSMATGALGLSTEPKCGTLISDCNCWRSRVVEPFWYWMSVARLKFFTSPVVFEPLPSYLPVATGVLILLFCFAVGTVPSMAPYGVANPTNKPGLTTSELMRSFGSSQ